MSLVSWYLIFVKIFMTVRNRRRSTKFLNEFWAASSLEQVENEIATHGVTEPFSHLTSHAIHARNHHAKYGALKLEEKGSTSAVVTRTIRKVIDEDTARQIGIRRLLIKPVPAKVLADVVAECLAVRTGD